jgi:phage terminase large subunit GpA-like protein
MDAPTQARKHVHRRAGRLFRPPPQLSVTAWAEQHRVLSSRGSAKPGPWRTARAPYPGAIMDALSAPHPARRVVFMKGAQTGVSEAGNNWLGYIVHHVPAPIVAVQPTVELAKCFSRQRIGPLLEETPALRDRVAPARARDSGNTMLSKEFPGGTLAWALAQPAGSRAAVFVAAFTGGLTRVTFEGRTVELDLSRFCAAPLIAYRAAKEMSHEHRQDG